jgi:hypothetical protein
VYNGSVGRALQVIWLILAVSLVVLLGQTMRLFDLPLVRDLPSMLPLGQAATQTAPPAPSAVAPTLAVPSKPVAKPSPVVVQQPDVCVASAPRFVLAMARLMARVGADMGAPTECEHVVDAAGDTEQKTTTGLAYYRANSNTAVFTNGVEHWALTADGLAHWTTDDLEPPPGADIQH